jgi:hypothetical protein
MSKPKNEYKAVAKSEDGLLSIEVPRNESDNYIKRIKDILNRLLAEGPFGTSLSEIHAALTGLKGNVIIRQEELIDAGETGVIVESWKTARSQMNPSAVHAQGKAVIGVYNLPKFDRLKK